MNKPVIIIGNGGHASVLTEILIQQQIQIIGFTAPYFMENQFALEYLGMDEVIKNYNQHEIELVLGIGMLGPNSFREKLFMQFKQWGYSFKTIIHSSAILAPSVELEEGVQVMAGAILQTHVKIADNTIVNTGVIIDHDCKIAEHVHIAPGSKISGNVHIDTSTHIATGVTIINGIKIGSSSLVGAGAVVVKHVSSNKKVYGVPAKEVK